MPTPKQPNGAKKLPKPRVMYVQRTAYDQGASTLVLLRDYPPLKTYQKQEHPVLVLPMPSKRAALAKKKYAMLPYEKRVERVARFLFAEHQLQFKPARRVAVESMTAEDLRCKGWFSMASRLLALQGEPTP